MAKCKLCGSDLDLHYNYCLYCGAGYIIDLEGDTILEDNSYGKKLLDRITDISVCSFDSANNKKVNHISNGKDCFNQYKSVQGFNILHPGENINLSVEINHKLINVPIKLPYTLAPVDVSVKIDSNYRLKAKVSNYYKESVSDPVDILKGGEVK